MAQPAWITYPQIEDLNSGRTTRDANTRLINNLTAMFGTTPNEFLTTSNVTFASVTATGTITANLFSGAGTSLTFGSGFDPTFGDVTAVTFVGDGSALTNLVSPGPGGSTSAGTLTMEANNAGGSPSAIHTFVNNSIEFGRFDSSGVMLIGDTANSKMAQGLTINQGANDNEIFAAKSSDVAHPITGLAEADTYFNIKKFNALMGGATLLGLSDGDSSGVIIQGAIGATSPSATTAATLFLAVKSNGGTGDAPLAATETAFQFRNFATNLVTILGDGGIIAHGLKSGTTQGGSGAAANELWVDTDDDNAIKRGV